MNDSSTSQETGITEAQAAERLLSHYQSEDQGPEDETGADEPQPEDEDAEALEADADDAEGDPDADPDDDPEDEQNTGQTFKVKVDGEELDVPLDELLKGYSREQDYTRKTQAVAEERKLLEGEKAAVAGTRTEYSARLEAVNKVLEANAPRVDQSLRETNPAEWSAQMLQHRQWSEQRQAIAAEQERLSAEAEREEAETLQKLEAETITTLRRDIPEWKDDAVYEAENLKLARYVGQLPNVTDDTLKGLRTDPTAISVLRKAMLYDELKAKAPDTRAKVEQVKTARPGPKTAPSRATDTKNARDRLAAEGSTDAAARLILMKQSRRA